MHVALGRSIKIKGLYLTGSFQHNTIKANVEAIRELYQK